MTTTQPERVPGDDPIDVLVPQPWSWWIRLTTAALLLAAVGTIGYLWHNGHLRPAPDCCGSGSAYPQLSLSADGRAVTITSYLFNSSGVDLVVTGAAADLPGAEVIEIAPVGDDDGFELPPDGSGAFPSELPRLSGRWFAVTFNPTRCIDDAGDWGSLVLDLEVGDSWLPTLGRSFTVPEPLAPAGPGQLGILPPPDLDDAVAGVDRPLAAACALLGR